MLTSKLQIIHEENAGDTSIYIPVIQNDLVMDVFAELRAGHNFSHICVLTMCYATAGEKQKHEDKVDLLTRRCLMLQNCLCVQVHKKQKPKMYRRILGAGFGYWISNCQHLHLGMFAPFLSQDYTHSLQPHSTGFSTSCVNEVPSSHSKVSRRRRTLRGAQQEAEATPCSTSARQ